mmetsp:Transcript_6395/g.10681  ORF Transcript_6395/g.10681 Transcript_6395/m.10681 type:complete len:255 (-) Transcript_6395:179-943(-)
MQHRHGIERGHAGRRRRGLHLQAGQLAPRDQDADAQGGVLGPEQHHRRHGRAGRGGALVADDAHRHRPAREGRVRGQEGGRVGRGERAARLQAGAHGRGGASRLDPRSARRDQGHGGHARRQRPGGAEADARGDGQPARGGRGARPRGQGRQPVPHRLRRGGGRRQARAPPGARERGRVQARGRLARALLWRGGRGGPERGAQPDEQRLLLQRAACPALWRSARLRLLIARPAWHGVARIGHPGLSSALAQPSL